MEDEVVFDPRELVNGAFVDRSLIPEAAPHRIGVRVVVASVPGLDVARQIEESPNPVEVEQLLASRSSGDVPSVDRQQDPRHVGRPSEHR